MWGFTRHEQRAILFLLSTFFIGCLVWWYRQSQPPPEVERGEIAAFEEFARQIQDSVNVENFRPSSQSDNKNVVPLALIDLNAATYEDLLRLPGVGPVLAQRILDYRKINGPFTRVQELRKVKGVGAKTYEKLARFVIVK